MIQKVKVIHLFDLVFFKSNRLLKFTLIVVNISYLNYRAGIGEPEEPKKEDDDEERDFDRFVVCIKRFFHKINDKIIENIIFDKKNHIPRALRRSMLQYLVAVTKK